MIECHGSVREVSKEGKHEWEVIQGGHLTNNVCPLMLVIFTLIPLCMSVGLRFELDVMG